MWNNKSPLLLKPVWVELSFNCNQKHPNWSTKKGTVLYWGMHLLNMFIIHQFCVKHVLCSRDIVVNKDVSSQSKSDPPGTFFLKGFWVIYSLCEPQGFNLLSSQSCHLLPLPHGIFSSQFCLFFKFVCFLAAPCHLWDLSSPTRDWTWALGSESTES